LANNKNAFSTKNTLEKLTCQLWLQNAWGCPNTWKPD